MSPFIRPAIVRHGDRVMSRSALLILLAVFTATFAGQTDNTDAEVEFQTTSSLVRNGTFELVGDTPESVLLLDAGNNASVTRGLEGRVYSWFGRGQALVGVPFYLVGAGLSKLFPGIEERHADTTYYGAARSEYFPHLLVYWRNALLTALTAWLLARAARRLGVSRPRALLAALVYGLTTYAWAQGRSTLSDVQATFFLFAAFARLLRFREEFERLRSPTRPQLFLFGACLGAAFLTRVQTAPAILVLLVAAFGQWRVGRRLLAKGEGVEPRRLWDDLFWLATPALACVALFCILNQRHFGSPWDWGYPLDAGFFNQNPLTGLWLLCTSPARGLLWLAPGLLLLPFGLRQAHDRKQLLWIWTSLGIFLAVFGPAASTQGWNGGWTYGPRYVLPALPVLWLGVALALQRFQARRLATRLALLLFGFGIVTNVPGALVDHMTHQYLALKAAHWELLGDPDLEVDPSSEYELFLYTQAQWRYAAPWAHWRILRHRVATGSDRFDSGSLYGLGPEAPTLEPPPHVSRDWGFQHLAWVDLDQRLGGSTWPAALITTLLLLGGVALGLRSLDPTLN